jgi:uncharacterized damage-inducible protein DinB
MRTHHSLRGALLAAALFATPALAQQPVQQSDPGLRGYRAELVKDIESLQAKYVGLAEKIPADKWTWRPAAGVRSIAEVYGHITNANFMIPTMAGAKAPESGTNYEKEADRAKVIAAMTRSFEHAKRAVQATPDAKLDEATKLFGQDATVRAVFHLLVTHMHEHLGQSIAYARSNAVTPPWSGGGD